MNTPVQRRVHAPTADHRLRIYRALGYSPSPVHQRHAERMAWCCACPTLRLRTSGKLVLCPGHCRQRLCPLCTHRRARVASERLSRVLHRVDAPKLLTLTVPHIDAPLRIQLRALRTAFGNLRRSPLWRSSVRGGVYTLEITQSARSGCWHPHFHALLDADYMPVALLRSLWHDALRATEGPWRSLPPGPCIIDLRAAHSRADAAAYLAKYITKPGAVASWEPASIREYADAVHGVRTFAAFGNLHAPPDPDADEPEAEHGSVYLASYASLGRLARARNIEAHALLNTIASMDPSNARFDPRPPDDLDWGADVALLPADADLPSIARRLEALATEARRRGP